MTTGKKPGPKGPHGHPRVVEKSLRHLAWQAMLSREKFTLSDLCRSALTGTETYRDPRGNIRRYVEFLAHAGVLQEFKHRAPPTSPTSNGEKRWRLAHNLGQKAPVQRKNGDLYDPNSGSTIAAPAAKPAETGDTPGVTPTEALIHE